MKLIEPHIATLSTAKDWFLGRYGLTELDVTAALDEIFQHRVDYADLYFQYARSESWLRLPLALASHCDRALYSGVGA